MLLKKLKPWNGAPTISSELEQASLIVADMSEQLFVKDIQIRCLTEQVHELKEELNAQKSDNASIVLLEILIDITAVDRKLLFLERTTTTDSDEKSLLRTYEETNLQLLEKIKLREAENQALLRRITQLSLRVSELEALQKESSLSNKASISSLSTAVEQPQDATTFINGLFEAINDNEDDNKLVHSQSQGEAVSQSSDVRHSCASLLLLNKTAIKDSSKTMSGNSSVSSNGSSGIKPRSSPTGRSIRSFSRRRVHQLSLYLNPLKDVLPISLPISVRSSADDLELEHLSTPVTPQSATFCENVLATLGSAKSLVPSSSSLLSSTSSTSSKKLNFGCELEGIKRSSSLKKAKVDARNFSPVSMDVITEN